MELAIPATSVVIDAEEYSILSNPEATSKVVLAEKDHLLGSLDLNTLVDDLGRVGKLVRLAFYAAKGSGYKEGMVEMKMMIYDIGIDITKLCNKSAQTVSSFRSTSRTVLQELHAAYEYLLDSFEDDAVDCFEIVSKMAERMALEARDLQELFERQQKEVRDAIEKLEKLEAKEGTEREESVKRRIELQKQEEEHLKQIQELQKLEEDTKKNREKYEAKRDEAIEKYEDSGFMVNLGRAITGAKDPAKEKVQEWKDESTKLYEIEKEHRRLRNEVLAKETDILSEMETCKFEEGETEMAIKSLNAVNHALMQLAAVMIRAALFWESIKKQCESITETGIKGQIERGMTKNSEEKRLKFWHSSGFKIKAVNYCAKWVALHSICSDYVERIRLTQSNLSGYISENPSSEEAREGIKGMIKEIKEDAAKVTSTNKSMDSVADDEIEKLKEYDECVAESYWDGDLLDEKKT